MARVAYRAIRQRKRFFRELGPRVQRGLHDAITRDVRPHMLRQFQNIVANWRNKPQFGWITNVEENKIEAYVEAFGPNAKYWVWTSYGTKRHRIRAKRAPRLAFRAKYTPKTTVKPSWGGPGTQSGAWRRPTEVNHPGTKPRNFEAFIARENKGWFSRTMENAWKRVTRRL